MSSDPKPPVVVEAWHFRNNERWYGYRFRVPRPAGLLQVYGPTAKEAENRMQEVLTQHHGKHGYSIKVMP